MASCFCVRLGKETVRVLDFRHCNLHFVPEEIVEYEDTVEELYLDSNDIRELPRDLFHCLQLKKLGVSDNELVTVPSSVASLIHLQELDISKNGIVELPDNIKSCKNLTLVEVSVNPLGKLPEGFTQLINLSQLYLNDTLLDYLPANFGRLTRLKVLELRENRLKALPKSIARLAELERLDLGQNSFREIPDVIGSLTKLTEVWIDANKVNQLPSSFGNLTSLVYFDASCNRLEYLPSEMENLESLTDLHLSKNFLHQLPDNIGKLSSLTTLKADNNQLASLPVSIGGLVSLEELILSANDLEDLPPSIGLLRRLRHLNVDDNMLQSVPSELGSCSAITLLSLRGNYLQSLPDEMGRIASLTVVNLSNNRLQCLPYSFTKLKNLQALWLSENQSKPLIQLQSEFKDQFGTRVLTCFMFPQQPQDYEEDVVGSDGESFHQSVWEQERARRMKIAFNVEETETEDQKNTARATTPYPKETFRPRFRMGVVSAPNGHVPSKRSHLAEKVNSPQMELLPNKPAVDTRSGRRVRGRRELELDGIRIREAKVTRPRSPGSTISDSLHLFKADKEKRAKDKARIRRTSSTEIDAEVSSPRSKGFFKKSKSDRAAHSDTEVVDPEWTPRNGSIRRSLTADQNLSIQADSSPSVDPQPTNGGDQLNHHEPRGSEAYLHQNGSVKYIPRGNVEEHSDRRGDSDPQRLKFGKDEKRRSSDGRDMFDGAGRHYVEEKWKGDPRAGYSAARSRRDPDERRGSYHRKSGYGTDPELEELYNNSLGEQISRKQPPPQVHHAHHAHHAPVKKRSGYDTDPEVRTRHNRVPHSSGLQVRNPHGRTPQSSRPLENGGKPDVGAYLNNPQSGYGTDSEIMAYNGPFDYSSPSEGKGKSSWGVQRTLERQSQKREEQRRDNTVSSSRDKVNDDGDEDLQWAFPNFTSPQNFVEPKRDEKMVRQEPTEEQNTGQQRQRSSDPHLELGRVAMANAGVEKTDGVQNLKETEKDDVSADADGQTGLHWDISEILGSSSRTVGHNSTDTPTHSPHIPRRVDGDPHVEGDTGQPVRQESRKLKSSTPDDGKQSEKVVSRQGRQSSSEVEAMTDQAKDFALTPIGKVHKDQNPLPPYSRKRDPKSSLPLSPAQMQHRASPLPESVRRSQHNPSPLPSYHQIATKENSPLMLHPRSSSRGPVERMNPEVKNAGGHLHIVKRQTVSADNRHTPANAQTHPKDTQRLPQDPQPKRPAIPSYEEAISRRRTSLGNKQSPSVLSLPPQREPGQPPVSHPQREAATSSENTLHDKNGRQASSTHSQYPVERLRQKRLPDDRKNVDDWSPSQRTIDHELQGQRHDRQNPHHNPQYRHGKDDHSRKDVPFSQERNIGQAKTVDYYTADKSRDTPHQHDQDRDVGYIQDNRHHWRERDHYEDTSDGGIGRGQSQVLNRERHEHAKSGMAHRQVDQDPSHLNSNFHDERSRNNNHSEMQSGGIGLGTNREIGSRVPQNATHSGRNTPVRGLPVPHASSSPGYDDCSPSSTLPNQQRDGSQAPVLTEENWRQQLLNRVTKKGLFPEGHQTPVAVRRTGDGSKSTVQERRLQVLRARLHNEMKTGEESADEVFHSPSLPPRPLAGLHHPSPNLPHQTHQTPPAHPNPQPASYHQQHPPHHRPSPVDHHHYRPPSAGDRHHYPSGVDHHRSSDTDHDHLQHPSSAINDGNNDIVKDQGNQAHRQFNHYKHSYPTRDAPVTSSHPTPDTSVNFKDNGVSSQAQRYNHYHPDATETASPKTWEDDNESVDAGRDGEMIMKDRRHRRHPAPETAATTNYPTPDTIANTEAKTWQEDSGRKGALPGYQHHRGDWSPPTNHPHHANPSLQMHDHINMEDFRRVTPPGSSGSSTTGCNGRGFAPSPALQRRIHPMSQTPLSQSPLPVRRADPDGTGGSKLIPVVIYKNPGLGFSITGGKNSPGNPFHPEDMGIFVTKVIANGPAYQRLMPGDKILEVNDHNFVDIDHEMAVQVLKNSNPVSMLISRET